MYSPIKSLPPSLLQREGDKYPPFRKACLSVGRGGVGGFEFCSFNG
jgi:hypothetical protein